MLTFDPIINIRLGSWRFGLGSHCLERGVRVRGGSIWIATSFLIVARGYF